MGTLCDARDSSETAVAGGFGIPAGQLEKVAADQELQMCGVVVVAAAAAAAVAAGVHLRLSCAVGSGFVVGDVVTAPKPVAHLAPSQHQQVVVVVVVVGGGGGASAHLG